MKRFLVTILSIFYLALSSSAAISVHFCEGEIENININSHLEGCCCGDAEIPKTCCHVKQIKLEIDIDQQIVSLSNIVPDNLVLINYFNFCLDILQELEIEETIIENCNLPPPKLEAIWITNCSLTYYG